MYTYRIATGLAEAELHPGLSYYHCVTRQKVICTVCTYIYYAACTREGCRVTSCTYCRRRWPRPETFYSVRVIFQEHNGNPLTVIMERSCARARARPFRPSKRLCICQKSKGGSRVVCPGRRRRTSRTSARTIYKYMCCMMAKTIRRAFLTSINVPTPLSASSPKRIHTVFCTWVFCFPCSRSIL